mmetsp:Transcript_3884/g.4556  ORF Transcript_3884/g.4556 Transcript_3884/m.4556 type:complete len:190 (+) Transcript_3884:172-741(+)
MLSGSCAGIIATFVSHPLDTVKVRFQTSKHDSLTLRHCIKDIYHFEGLRGFFKGVTSPMIGRTPITAILFGSREFAIRKLNNFENLGINTKMAMSGAFAGFCYTNVAFVFDLLKVRAQFDKKKQINYKQEISRIYREEGLKGFLNGYQGMLLRDFPGFAFYFMSYELIKRNLSSFDPQTEEQSTLKKGA